MNNIIKIIEGITEKHQNYYATETELIKIFNDNGMEFFDYLNNKVDFLEGILTKDDVIDFFERRADENQDEVDNLAQYLTAKDILNRTDDFNEVNMLQESVDFDKENIKDYSKIEDRVFCYCDGGDYEFYLLTWEDVIHILKSEN